MNSISRLATLDGVAYRMKSVKLKKFSELLNGPIVTASEGEIYQQCLSGVLQLLIKNTSIACGDF